MVEQVESRVQAENGWLFVPFYTVMTVLGAHILLEDFVRQYPSPSSSNGSNSNQNQQQQCESQADEIVRQMEKSINVLQKAKQKYEKEDIGSVEIVLGKALPVEYRWEGTATLNYEV
jgi:peptide subunit release factor RF-3